MKHIKIFSSVTEYETVKSGGTLITPNVSGDVIYLVRLLNLVNMVNKTMTN